MSHCYSIALLHRARRDRRKSSDQRPCENCAVLDPALVRQLDNPVWSCLTTRHAHLALGNALARRYPVDISPIAGLPNAGAANIAALEALVDVGDTMATPGPYVPSCRRTGRCCCPAPDDPHGRATLPGRRRCFAWPEDVPEMLALVELTQPGPFRPRTIELGRFLGIRENGKLVAMAGERMWIGDCHEVSGVCTHPGVQGRGYAKALMARVINRMLRSGETPFLHVESPNVRAIAVYRALGFVTRAAFPLLYAKRLG